MIDIRFPEEYPFKPPIVSQALTSDEIRHQDLASEYLVANWGDLFRHPQKGVDACTYYQNCFALSVGFALLSRTRYAF